MTVALVVAAYLLGSVPVGLLLGRRAGVDVRRHGSGSIGATNVARTAGLALGVATLVADTAKGALPVLAAGALGAGVHGAAAAGVAAVFGHVYPPALRFAGGKGVATALGVMLALAPLVAFAALAVFAAAIAATRRVSVGSLLGALAAPGAAALLGESGGVTGACVAMAAVVLLRHRDNLARLRGGTEPAFTLPKRQAPPGD